MIPRPMRQEEEETVRDLFALGHPGWSPRSDLWYFAHPTLVIEAGAGLAGFCSFSLGSLQGLLMLQGQDLVVTPVWRNRGIGTALHRGRLVVGRDVGATVFSGFTQSDNVGMQRIFERAGHHACQTVRHYYPDGQDAVLWLGALTE